MEDWDDVGPITLDEVPDYEMDEEAQELNDWLTWLD